MKYTPGPWKVINRPESGKTIRVGLGKNFNDIAVIYDLPPQTGQAEANARLIAASPILYEYALEQANNGCEKAKSILASLGITN
jgi:hypothetical protein